MDVAYSVSSDSASDAINDVTSDEYVSLSDSDETIHYYALLSDTCSTHSDTSSGNTYSFQKLEEQNLIQQFPDDWDNETRQMSAMEPYNPSGAAIQDLDSTTFPSKTSKGIKRNKQDSSDDAKMMLESDINQQDTRRYKKIRVILSESEDDKLHEVKARQKCNRRRKDCSIKGCHSIGLLKLANHLTSVHNIKNKETRLKWLNMAKSAPMNMRKQTSRPFKKAMIICSDSDSDNDETILSTKSIKLKQQKHLKTNRAANTPCACSSSMPGSSRDYYVADDMINKHTNAALCFDFNGFTKYLTSIAGGQKSPQTHYDLLLDMENLQTYLQYLRHHFSFAATTISEKIRRLRLAIEYTLHIENSDESNTIMFMRCTKILTNLLKWGKSLSKDIQKQRHKQSLKSAQKVRRTNNPSGFLESKEVLEAVENAFEIARDAMINSQEYLLIITYIAASMIFPYAQRPGVVQHMMINEYEEREHIDEKVVIQVLNHKTCASRGPASIVITPNVEKMINDYLQYIRKFITPKTVELSDNLFLSYTGNEFRKASEGIQKVARIFDISTPPPSLHRKVIASEGRKNLDEGNMRLLATHMSHSEATSRRFYQFPLENEACEIHETI